MTTCSRCGSGVGPFVDGRCPYCCVTSQIVVNVVGAPSDHLLKALREAPRDAAITVATYEADADITPFDPPYDLSCPLCSGLMVGRVTIEETFVLVECEGRCRRAWRVPNKRGEANG